MIKVIISFLLLLFIVGCNSNKEEDSQTTKALTQRPLIFQLSPTLSSPYGHIPVNSRLVVTSSEALNPLTVNTANVLLFKDKEPVNIKVHLVGQDIVVTPWVYLDDLSSYTLQITTGVTTNTGKSLTRSTYLYLESGSQLDFDAPTLIKTLPDINQTYAMELYTHIYFKFSEPISPFLLPESYKITVNGFPDVNYTNSQFKISGDTLSIIPDFPFPYETSITIELNTSTLTDLAGNHFNGSSIITIYSGTVLTGSDTPKTLFEEREGPANPGESFLSTLTFNTQRHINNLIINDNTLYIATQEGLLLLDFNAFTGEFTPQGSLDYDKVGYIYDVVLYQGNILFLASSKGVITLDISNKKAPKILALYKSTSPVYALTMGDSSNDNTLYAAGTLKGLLLFGIDTAGIPHLSNTIDLNASLMDVSRNKDSDIILALYNHGAKLYEPTSSQVIPMPYTLPNDTFRQVTEQPTLSTNFFAADIGGVVALDPASSLYPRIEIPTASCVTKVEAYHANVKDIGLAGFFFDSVGQYATFNFNIQTFTLKDYGSLQYTFIFLADDEGVIHIFLEPLQ